MCLVNHDQVPLGISELAPQVVHEVTLLRVIEAAAEGPEAERYLREAVQRRQHAEVAPPGEMVCWHDVVQGDPAQTILDVAAPNKLVVMATHGRSGLARWALGSVADRVARGGAAGVLLVRTRAAPQAPAT